MEQNELTVLTVDEVISNELVKANVTDTLIASLKERYMPLRIAGIDDKETYQLVKEGRKEAKKWRVAAEKICKAGREEANKISKAWVAKEKEVTDQISEVEDYLEKQEKEYEAAVAKDKEERKRKQDEQLIVRQQVLTKMGVLYADGKFALGEVEFEMSLVKECEQDIWEESILPKFKAEYEKIEAERIEQDRIKQEREAELKRQQEEMLRKEKELADREAALKKAEEERVKKENEEATLKAAAAKAEREAKEKARMDQLTAFGLRFDFNDNHFKGYDCFVPMLDLRCDDDEKWAKNIKVLGEHIASKKEELEQKRLAEIEAQKEVERKRTLGVTRFQTIKAYDYTNKSTDVLANATDEEWEYLHEEVKIEYDLNQKKKWEAEQEEKRKLEEIKKQQDMEQAKDKEKWEEILRKVNDIEVYEMRSSQYRKKAMILREKLEQIKSL